MAAAFGLQAQGALARAGVLSRRKAEELVANGRVTVNVAAYHIDWSNIQAQANRVSDSVQFATNIGSARSQGFELEMGVVPATDVFVDPALAERIAAEERVEAATLHDTLTGLRAFLARAGVTPSQYEAKDESAPGKGAGE